MDSVETARNCLQTAEPNRVPTALAQQSTVDPVGLMGKLLTVSREQRVPAQAERNQTLSAPSLPQRMLLLLNLLQKQDDK